MPTVGFEPTISACERLQTYALDRAVTGTGTSRRYLESKLMNSFLEALVYSSFNHLTRLLALEYIIVCSPHVSYK